MPRRLAASSLLPSTAFSVWMMTLRSTPSRSVKLVSNSPPAVERLTTFDWPGNVRQLQNEIQRAVLLSEGPEVNVTDLSISDVKFVPTEGHDTSFTLLEGVERNAIVQMLKETGGNKLETAKRLGIGRQTLYNKIKAYGIDV